MSIIKKFIYHLRSRGVCVNFIEAPETPDINQPPVNEIQAFLDQILPIDGQYKYKRIDDRHVVYPADIIWEKKISGINIRELSRIDAAEQYAAQLQNFGITIEAPPVKGDPGSPVYTETVSLDADAILIEHLLQLLGNNRWLVFTVEKTSTNLPMIHFDEVGNRLNA